MAKIKQILMNKLVIFRILLWGLLFLSVAWILVKAIVPSGHIRYFADLDKNNFFISNLNPEERREDNKILGDPVYFNLRTSRKFNQASLKLKYRRINNNSLENIPVIEAGILVDKNIWRYDLRPVDNLKIEKLSSSWAVIKENDLIFLQKNKNFNSINEFLDNPPSLENVAIYNHDLKNEYLISDYQPSDEEIAINYSLRGPWQFYTYVKDEDLNFDFKFSDINQNKDTDQIDLNIYYQNNLILVKHLDDDGITDDKGEAGDSRKMQIDLSNLPEGVYKFELRVNNDIITENLKTKQNKLAFINKVWVEDFYDEKVVYTDSKQINAQTTNPGSVQSLKINNLDRNRVPIQGVEGFYLGTLNIRETFKLYSLKSTSSSSRIEAVEGDIILSGDGMFSFSQASLFNPNVKKVDALFSVEDESVEYIIADYSSPVDKDGWRIAEVEFDLTRAYREDKTYSFIISIPGLRVEDEIDDGVEIDSIEVELEGKSLREFIGDRF